MRWGVARLWRLSTPTAGELQGGPDDLGRTSVTPATKTQSQTKWWSSGNQELYRASQICSGENAVGKLVEKQKKQRAQTAQSQTQSRGLAVTPRYLAAAQRAPPGTVPIGM